MNQYISPLLLLAIMSSACFACKTGTDASAKTKTATDVFGHSLVHLLKTRKALLGQFMSFLKTEHRLALAESNPDVSNILRHAGVPQDLYFRKQAIEELLILKNKRISYGFFELFADWAYPIQSSKDLDVLLSKQDLKAELALKGPVFLDLEPTLNLADRCPSSERLQETNLPIFAVPELMGCKELWPQIIGLTIHTSCNQLARDLIENLKAFVEQEKRKITIKMHIDVTIDPETSAVSSFEYGMDFLRKIIALDMGPIRELTLTSVDSFGRPLSARELADASGSERFSALDLERIRELDEELWDFFRKGQLSDLVSFRFDRAIRNPSNFLKKIAYCLPADLERFAIPIDFCGEKKEEEKIQKEETSFLDLRHSFSHFTHLKTFQLPQGDRIKEWRFSRRLTKWETVAEFVTFFPKTVRVQGVIGAAHESAVPLLSHILKHDSNFTDLTVKGFLEDKDLTESFRKALEGHPELKCNEIKFILNGTRNLQFIPKSAEKLKLILYPKDINFCLNNLFRFKHIKELTLHFSGQYTLADEAKTRNFLIIMRRAKLPHFEINVLKNQMQTITGNLYICNK